MELSPQAVAAATFRTVKRGYDPDEVRAYLVEVSAALEASHQQATAMEARARAAIAKLQDATQHAQQSAPSTGPVPVVAPSTVASEDADAISRTLLLAQRTADATIAEAKAQAAVITEQAHAEASTVGSVARREAAAAVEQARAEAARVLDEARAEAARSKSEHHLRVEAEVRELESRRTSLVADIGELERRASTQRDRLREAAEAIARLADQVPVELPSADTATSSGAASSAGAASSSEAAAPSDPTPVSAAAPAPIVATASDTGEIPRPRTNGDHSGPLLAPPTGSLRGTGPITGQVPVQPGVEPLVSPRPTSAEEVRSLWAEAERAERAEQAANGGRVEVARQDDITPIEGIPVVVADEPTPAEGTAR